ncbi:amidase signature domain-containing protein [Xylariaceae sp. FL1272]|nr:amidase signature domain-containing protein [Xylariaceae sp. FL1272]
MIPVPSRLYTIESSPSKPLAGLRFGVKDAIDVAGLETGIGSRDYRNFYPAKESTAPCISALIAAGAILVGKTRLCQWCDSQDPLERLEEVTPFNPRGDGFQKPSASSSGSASACASYEWLDFTVGTDTGGSIRHPAGVNGVYGVRPSLGSVLSTGLVCTALMDTVGVFTRSPVMAQLVMSILAGWTEIGGTVSSLARGDATRKRRFKLLYAVMPEEVGGFKSLKFFPPGKRIAGDAAQDLMNAFVERLETHLECTRTPTCIEDLWTATHPEGYASNLNKATGTIYRQIVYGTMWRDVVAPFVREFTFANGREPFIETVTKARLESGAKLRPEDLDLSIASFHAFSTWLNETLFSAAEQEDIPLLVFPQTVGSPHYRDDVVVHGHGGKARPGFSVYSISSCSGCPDVTIPVGEVPFVSRLTGTQEFLPVTVSLMAPRGMDSCLLDLLSELQSAGVLRPVACGPRLFPSD